MTLATMHVFGQKIQKENHPSQTPHRDPEGSDSLRIPGRSPVPGSVSTGANRGGEEAKCQELRAGELQGRAKLHPAQRELLLGTSTRKVRG